MKKIRKWPYVLLVVGALAASTFISVESPRTNSNPQQFSHAAIIILAVTIIIPYLAAWILSVMSWYSFNQLVRSGRQQHWAYAEGFHLIAVGIGLLVLDLIGSTLFSSARNLFINQHRPAMYMTIGGNLFHVLVPLLAFVSMYLGTKELLKHSDYANKIKNHWLPVIIPTVIFTLLFSILALDSPTRQISFDPKQLPIYYLPDVLIVLLVILPLAVTWALGLRVVLNTERYVHSLSHENRTKVVKFFYGLLAVISSYIIVQAITALGNQRLQDLGTVFALVLLYLFIILQAAAYGFIYQAAQGLRHLPSEDVK